MDKAVSDVAEREGTPVDPAHKRYQLSTREEAEGVVTTVMEMVGDGSAISSKISSLIASGLGDDDDVLTEGKDCEVTFSINVRVNA